MQQERNRFLTPISNAPRKIEKGKEKLKTRQRDIAKTWWRHRFLIPIFTAPRKKRNSSKLFHNTPWPILPQQRETRSYETRAGHYYVIRNAHFYATSLSSWIATKKRSLLIHCIHSMSTLCRPSFQYTLKSLLPNHVVKQERNQNSIPISNAPCKSKNKTRNSRNSQILQSNAPRPSKHNSTNASLHIDEYLFLWFLLFRDWNDGPYTAIAEH